MKPDTIIVLGPIHACVTNHEIREFRVQIISPLENEEKEELLENLRSNIHICYRGVGVDKIILEEE